MKTNPILIKALGLSIAMTAPASVLASLDINFYGSARMQAESVSPDSGTTYESGESDSYVGVRDAYSRLGFKANWQASDSLEVFGQLEIPFDIANFKVQDPYDDTRDLRVAQVGVNTDHGSLAYGQMWLPYYNSIAYKVDRFSTYYSGYATFATFRAYNAVSYYSPAYNGFSVGAGYIIGTDDANQADTRTEDSYQLTLNYAQGNTDISLGLDNQAGDDNTQLFGLAIGQKIDNLYIGAKAEVFRSDDSSGGYADNDTKAYNIYADYTLGNNTFKAMIAQVENYGENIVHLGVDHQLNKDFKVFVEYYQQEDWNAIANRKAGGGGDFADSLTGGGNALAVGFRYDF